MTKDEMRFLRREIINSLLHKGCSNLIILTWGVRLIESQRYDAELKVY
jgi:hypothetical protein